MALPSATDTHPDNIEEQDRQAGGSLQNDLTEDVIPTFFNRRRITAATDSQIYAAPW